MAKILITPERLQLAEPLMAKYFDYDPTMLFDEKFYCTQVNKIDCTYRNDNSEYLTVDCVRAFYEHKELKLKVTTPYKKENLKHLKDDFQLLSDIEKEAFTDDDVVMLCLEYMSYVYHKTSKNHFNNSVLIEMLDLDYDMALHNTIYPEMLSLYRMILESEEKGYRKAKVTISCEDEKIEINSHAWFIDDMKKYFAERFPAMTKEKINEIMPRFKGKAGRKSQIRNMMNIIWGTYHLLRKHHSRFKRTKVKISNEICDFITDYLYYMNIEFDNIIKSDVRVTLKDMLKRNYTPKWNIIWRNVFYDIEEKQPENIFDRLVRKYDIY